jgi:hypothetical protein
MPSMPEPEEPERLMDRVRDSASEVVRIASRPSGVPNGFIVALFIVIVLLVVAR